MEAMKLTDVEIREKLQSLPGWELNGDVITQTFKFADFTEAMAFMNSAAPVAEELQHHPEWTNVYNRVEVRLTTHDEGGVTEKDFELAEAMQRLGQQTSE